jgi:hypothetical protein
MVRKALVLLFLTTCQITFSQHRQLNYELIRLGRIYALYSGSKKDAASTVTKQTIYEGMPDDQVKTREFLNETTLSQNNIINEKFLTLPDTLTLRNLYVIRSVAWNQGKLQKKDLALVDSLLEKTIPYNDLVSCYYNILFSAVVAKNTPLYLSKIDFNTESYNLKSRAEKAIFFLESMSAFSLLFNSAMESGNKLEKMNALAVFDHFPSYDGKPYYKFAKLDFDDFDYAINPEGSTLSYRTFYLYIYMRLLDFHYSSLTDLKKSQKRSDFESNSIILFPEYREFLNPEAFEKELIEEKEKWMLNFTPDKTKQ